MNKRLILAIGLSFLIMMMWSRLIQKFYPIETQEVIKEEASLPVVLQVPEPAPQETTVGAISHNRELVFSLPSASLSRIIFSKYGNYEFILDRGLYLAEQDLVFELQRLDSREAVFISQGAGRRVTKRFNYSDPNFMITLEIKIENLSEQPLAYSSNLLLATINLKSGGLDSRFREVFIKQPDRILRLSPGKKTNIHYSGEFFGFRDRYFCAILIPISVPETFTIIRANNTESRLALRSPTINMLSNQTRELQYKIYLGPQRADVLESFNPGAGEVIYYGFFDPIAKILLNILRLFFRLVHNWGWAVVMLSVVIFFALFPLTLKQLRSTKEMQHLQPKIEELRRLYKDNPQRLNKETLELYRKNKINPLGGCLPMIGQIPIFFSLYQGLMRSIELKGADFLWIKDLSEPDRLITSPEINILPILMAITMFLQQKFSMMPTSGPTGEQQRLMTFLFPVLFGFIFYRMPSGLVLYWFINSLLMFVYQMKIKVAHEPIQH